MPISLACRSPGTVPNSKCTLLVADGKSLENAPAPPSATPSVLPPAPPVDQDEDQSEDSAEMDNEQGVYEQTQDMEYAYPESKDMHEIFRFIAGEICKALISPLRLSVNVLFYCEDLRKNLRRIFLSFI